MEFLVYLFLVIPVGGERKRKRITNKEISSIRLEAKDVTFGIKTLFQINWFPDAGNRSNPISGSLLVIQIKRK